MLAAGLSPSYFSDVMKGQVPADWIGSIADARGILIARVPDVGAVGQPIIPTLRKQLGQKSGNWIETESRSGGHIYSSFVRSEPLGWTAFLALPKEYVTSSVWSNVSLLGGVVVVAFASSLLLAWILATWILQSLTDFGADVLRDWARAEDGRQAVWTRGGRRDAPRPPPGGPRY